MSSIEKIREGLTERGIDFTEPIFGSTWFNCAGCDMTFVRCDGEIHLTCYGMTAEQVLAFVDMMESK